MRNVLASGLLLCFSLFQHVNAQEIWDLERCIGYAIDNNLTVELSELNIQLAETSVTRAKGNFLPNLNAGGTYQINYGQTIDPFTNQFAVNSVQSNSLFLSSGWTIFSGLQNLNTLKRSQLDYLVSKYDLEDTKYDIALLVTQSYLNILFFLEQQKVAEEQIKTIQEQVDRSEKLFNAGTIPKGSLLEIQAQLAQEEVNLINTGNNLTLAYLDLKQTLLLETDYNMVVSVPTIDTVDYRLPENTTYIVDMAYENLPSIKSREYRLLSAEKDVKIAKGVYSPTLNLNGSLGTGYSGNNKEFTNPVFNGFDTTGFVTTNGGLVLQPDVSYDESAKPFSTQADENFNQSWGFQLSIPIFNRFQVSQGVEQARINEEIAETMLEQERLTVRQSIERSFADAKAALKSYRATQKSMESLSLAFDYAKQRFDVGMITAVEYNQAKNNLFRAEAELVQAKYDYVFKYKILQYYRGDVLNFETTNE